MNANNSEQSRAGRAQSADARQKQTRVLEEEGYTPPPKRRTTPKVAQLRKQIRPKLLATPDEADSWDSQNPEHQKIIHDRLDVVLKRANIDLSPHERQELEQALIWDVLGFAAIEPLVRDRSYSEIMVNGPEIIFAERNGKLIETEVAFDDEEHLQWMAQRVVRPLQRDLSRRNPMVDARLPDGSRVHMIAPPSALQGTTVTIRKFPDKRLTIDDLIRFGSVTPDVAAFLEACVQARLNVVVSGGTGSGKTTLLNVLSSFIPEDERIVTIEDSAELNLSQRHVVRLETCPVLPGTKEGSLVIRDLVKGSLRMRPDRIVIGECRSGEALDMLQAMNTGHDGSLTTLHANGPREAITRLETMCMMAGMDMPQHVIRTQIASAVDVIVQQARLKDGSRKITQVTELQGMEGESVTLQDIFVYRTPDQQGTGPSHMGGGTLEPTGFRPRFYHRFEELGFRFDAKMFGADRMQFSRR
ncbi:MAG: CpaF family protein [Anaerolineae bacterium]|nr:CpaF family protein [Anaerolineae bacterium]